MAERELHHCRASATGHSPDSPSQHNDHHPHVPARRGSGWHVRHPRQKAGAPPIRFIHTHQHQQLMQLKLTSEQIKELTKLGITAAAVEIARWDNDTVFESYEVPPGYIVRLAKHARANPKSYNGILQKLAQLERVLKAPKTHKCTRLDTLSEAILQSCLVQSPNRWLFDIESEVPSPWLVTGCAYTPANCTRDRDEPARVTLSLAASVRGSKTHKHLTFHQDDLMISAGERDAARRAEALRNTEEDHLQVEETNAKLAKYGVTVEDILAREGFVFEAPELKANYDKYVAEWEVLWKQHFQQFTYVTRVIDEAEDEDDATLQRQKAMADATLGASEYKVVNDVPTLKLRGEETTLRIPALKRSIEEGTEDDTDIFHIPIHPWLYVFNLETHSHMWVAPHKVKAYVYDTGLVERLILPDPHKQLIRLLTSNPDTLAADFVRGKSAGTIIMATGNPGLGKTMSAEAYSEGSQTILYKVQSDQLGLSPDAIEKNLKEVFARALRWNAVLLIDECDIYVRARGTDIKQNAIVGTLLRTLEYFNGVIFMTTNRATEIDDAIMSRCSAVIRYDYPSAAHALAIFDQFATLFKLTVPASVIKQFLTSMAQRPTLKEFAADGHPQISGRTIKNLLRLTARQGISKPSAKEMLDTMEYLAT